jgi:hypothetical protein
MPKIPTLPDDLDSQEVAEVFETIMMLERAGLVHYKDDDSVTEQGEPDDDDDPYADEEFEDDIIKQINALWDWLRNLVEEVSKAPGVAAAAEEEEK